MNESPSDFEERVARHDREAAERALEIWLGAEPTFTDRFSEAAEWLSAPLGADKEQRARRLVQRLREVTPGALVLRTVGRQYAGEPVPRWSYGIYARRDGAAIWSGPPDALAGAAAPPPIDPRLLPRLQRALLAGLAARGWSAGALEPDGGNWRILFRCGEQALPIGQDERRGEGRAASSRAEDRRVENSRAEGDAGAARFRRGSLHRQPIPASGLRDELAESGLYLLVLRAGDALGGGSSQLSAELPAIGTVPRFLQLLEVLGDAARQADVSSLCLCGFPPPVDPSVLHTTVTPDPAVVEVNQAPAPDVSTFLRWNRQLFALAEQVGLWPYRLHYNGVVSDSGGAGQVTLGGPTPERSPFFVAPRLLPRLVRYLLRHPSLSYWFAPQYVGGGSQSPRPDEGLPESFRELGVALEQLERLSAPTPELLWGTLQHFLADCSGNPHRAELNIEKLYNPYLPRRGCLGLVEFRALRMPPSAERLAGIALLLRAVALLLAREDRVPELTCWGDQLHDRFALPSLLRQDLAEVFADLGAAGLGLGRDVEALLLGGDERLLGRLALGGCQLEVEQALEFWPLVGDVASQEAGGSRLVDASTSRLELRLSASAALDDWQLLVNGYRLPLRELPGASGVRLLGVRYRSFVPLRGLHPSIPAEARIVIELLERGRPRARVTLHPWRPDGLPYEGLPRTAAEARQRRSERFVVEQPVLGPAPVERSAPASALSPYCLDLRRTRP